MFGLVMICLVRPVRVWYGQYGVWHGQFGIGLVEIVNRWATPSNVRQTGPAQLHINIIYYTPGSLYPSFNAILNFSSNMLKFGNYLSEDHVRGPGHVSYLA